MQNNHLNITYAYHFLSEAIIIFLLALPFLHYHYFWVPYGSYWMITLGACIVFTVITRFTTSYSAYILMAPVFCIVFYILDYPMLMAILFAGLFVWRYIDIRKEELISRENNYILFTLILTAFDVLLIDDSRIMLYPFFQFIILVLGYIVSNLAVVNKEDRKQFDKKLSLYFVGLLGLSAGVFYLLFAYARTTVIKIWDLLLALITGIFTVLAKLLSFIDIEKREWSDDQSSQGESDFEYWNKLEEFNIIDTIGNYWVISLGLLFLAIVLFFVLILARKRFRGTIDQLEIDDESVTYAKSNQIKQTSRSVMSPFHRFFKKPKHPIRKMIYQFESKAAKTKKGRFDSETVEEWMVRTGWDVDLEVYEKVRYGSQDVSDQDIQLLKQQLKKVEGKLEV